MTEKEKKVLVTGGAGFIGSHLCGALLEGGYRVVCLDNLLTGEESNIEGYLGESGFEWVEGNVEDRLECEPDYIFHLASPASPADYTRMPVRTLIANSYGTLNCLELSKKTGARMLMGSTSEVYGDSEVSPQGEDYFGNVNPVGPRSCYDEGKRFAEALCTAYRREFEIDVVVLRIFNTYGTRMRKDDGRVIPNFVNQAISGDPVTVYGDGNQTRSFCHVRDMVKGLLAAMRSSEVAGEVINLGNPEEIRIIDLAARIKQKVGSASSLVFEPLPQDDPMMRRPDITKAMELLSWAPEVDIENGLGEVIEWFRGEGR